MGSKSIDSSNASVVLELGDRDADDPLEEPDDCWHGGFVCDSCLWLSSISSTAAAVRKLWSEKFKMIEVAYQDPQLTET